MHKPSTFFAASAVFVMGIVLCAGVFSHLNASRRSGGIQNEAHPVVVQNSLVTPDAVFLAYF